MPDSGTWSGRPVSSPGFDEETRSYLQRRLRLLTGTLGLLLSLLGVAFVGTFLRAPGTGLVGALVRFLTEFPNSILAAMLSANLAIYLLLRFREVSSRTLGVLDGIFLQVLTVPCLIIYATLHNFSFSGFSFVVSFLILFLLTRAVLLPSTAMRTFWLSLPAPIGVLLIQLYHGDSLAAPGQSYGQSHYLDMLIQNQICLIGATVVATVASRVNLNLRRRTYDAKRVGQYEIEEMIGKGAMGEVYRARHALLKRPTALKFLRPEITGEGTLRRFEQEVRQLARLTHPNTVSIFDYGRTAEGVFYYAMELLEGATLREIVEKTGPMPPERVIHVLAQAGAALHEAHAKGILHRDIKPANLILYERAGEFDVLKIVDFGLAKQLDPISCLIPATGTVAGTPETMSPETFRGEAIGPRSDIYSLSVVGYFLLTGRPLFDASRTEDFLRHHLETRPVPPAVHVPDLPSDLEEIIMKGLSKSPEERPPDALTMRELLQECEDAHGWTQEHARTWWSENESSPPADRVTDPASEEVSETSMMTAVEGNPAEDLRRS